MLVGPDKLLHTDAWSLVPKEADALEVPMVAGATRRSVEDR